MVYDNVKKLCVERGTSFHAVERELELGNGLIAKWAKCSPSVYALKKVADYFGVTVDELLREEGA